MRAIKARRIRKMMTDEVNKNIVEKVMPPYKCDKYTIINPSRRLYRWAKRYYNKREGLKCLNTTEE